MSIATLLNRPGAGVALLLMFYLLVAVLFSVLSPWFLSFDNMVSIGANMAFIGLMCALQTPLIIAGGLDLSVAAVAGLAGVVVALLHASGVGIVAACLIALALGGGIGLLNGLLVVRLGLNSLIATLGTMSVIGGLALVLTGGLTKPLMEPGFNWIGSGQLLRLPVATNSTAPCPSRTTAKTTSNGSTERGHWPKKRGCQCRRLPCRTC